MPGIGVGVTQYLSDGPAAVPSDVTPFIYNLRILNPDAIYPDRDGPVNFFSGNNLIQAYGWNGTLPFLTGFNPSTVEVNVSSDFGVTFTAAADAPGPPRHFVPHCGSWLGYDAWVFGGDSLYDDPTTNVVAYQAGVGFVEITADWGLGGLTLAAGCLHNNEFYILCGRGPDGDTTKVRKTSDGINFTDVGDLPFHSLTAKAISFGGYIYFLGGTQSPGSNDGPWNDKVIRSLTGATGTWEEVATLSEEFLSTWPDGDIFDGKFFYSPGYGPNTVLGDTTYGNKKRWFYTTDFITWTLLLTSDGLPTPNPTSHAIGCVGRDGLNSGVYVTGGNNVPQSSYIIEKLNYYDAFPNDCEQILMLRNGVFMDGSPLTGSYCGQVANDDGTDTFEVGFIGGEGEDKWQIDVAAVEAWADGRDFYWSIIYDRSGNNNHSSNTVGNRYTAGIAGVMIIDDGSPAAYSPDAGKYHNFVSPIELESTYIMSTVIKFTASNKEFYSVGSGYGILSDGGSNLYHYNGNPSYAQCAPGLANNVWGCIEWYRTGSSVESYVNRLKFPDPITMGGDSTVTDLRGEAGFAGSLYWKQSVLKKSFTLADKISLQYTTNNFYDLYVWPL